MTDSLYLGMEKKSLQKTKTEFFGVQFILYAKKGQSMQQNDYLQVGVITSTHGIKGEVKVFPTTDDPNRFRTLKDVVLDTGKEQIPLEIEGVKFFKQYVILKFKGIDNINDI